LLLANPAIGQQQDDSSGQSAASSLPAPSIASAVVRERPVSWKRLVPNLFQDQKSIWLFPVRLAQGKHLKPALAFVLSTSVLVALDPHDTPYFRRTSTFRDFNKALNGRNTTLGTAIFPLSFYAAGLAAKNRYAQDTALLAGQAVVGAQILTTIMKNIDRRLRPIDIPPDGDFAHSWFKSGGVVIRGRGSFPSGHTIAAFSVATVFAKRYPRPWVPWVAYSLAGLVGFSRVTLQSHFLSDVFAGAVLGYTISNYVVLRKR
jgi:membrane-associated phospholipid phosphatase